jgi:hypothetical protein
MGDGLFRRRNAAAGEKDNLNLHERDSGSRQIRPLSEQTRRQGRIVTYWDDRIYFTHGTKKSGEVAISEIRPTVYHRCGIFDEDKDG